jgi:hypothetical protein
MNDLIQSLPSPLAYSKNYSHMDGGIMDGWWRGVGDDDGDDLLQIPVPVGCQNRVSGSESGFLLVSAQENSIWEKRQTPEMFSGQKQYVGKKRGRGNGWGGHTTPWSGLAWPAPPGGVGPLRLLSVSSSGSVCLLVK